jgi:hypothetical protein
MQPENFITPSTPEKMPSMPRPEIDTAVELKNDGVEKGAENFEQRSETKASISDVGIATITTNTPDVKDKNIHNDVEKSTIVDAPTVASDDDLIEKEWVERAKRIITETVDDPYSRDEEVSKLQVEYIKKRYGRSIGESE